MHGLITTANHDSCNDLWSLGFHLPSSAAAICLYLMEITSHKTQTEFVEMSIPWVSNSFVNIFHEKFILPTSKPLQSKNYLIFQLRTNREFLATFNSALTLTSLLWTFSHTIGRNMIQVPLLRSVTLLLQSFWYKLSSSNKSIKVQCMGGS